MKNLEIKSKKSIEIYNKINEILDDGDKQKIAEILGITPTSFSYQLRTLKKGKGISTITLEVIGEYKKYNFFSF